MCTVVSTSMPPTREWFWLAALAGPFAGSASLAQTTAAGDGACTTVTIAEPPWIEDAWRAALDELRAEIAKLSASQCRPVSFSLLRARGKLVLRATAPDGRVAEREVRDASSLPAIALGLLASIPPESIPPAPTPAPAPATTTVDPTDAPPRDVAPRARAGTVERPPIQLSLGAAAGARVGEPTGVVMGDLEARADLYARGWLVVASARFAVVGARPGGARIEGYGYNEYAFGLGLGRRIDLGATALDIVLMPTLVVMDEEGGPSGVAGDTASGGDNQLRFGSSARWTFARTNRWGWGVTLDGDFAPSAARKPTRLDVPLPPLPSWTFGLRLGAAGDVL